MSFGFVYDSEGVEFAEVCETANQEWGYLFAEVEGDGGLLLEFG